MSIVVVGDIHGKIQDIDDVPGFNSIIASKTKPDDLVIQVGDIGFGFGFIPHFPENVKLIRGNHDDPQMARLHPNYLGDYGYLPEHKLFYLGGAWSIDWAWRKAYMNRGGKAIWWENEELSYHELAKALELYSEVKPEIVISHEAPASVVPHVLSKITLDFKGSTMDVGDETSRSILYHRPEKLECIYTRTSAALQKMLDVWQPKHWVFGHYHIKKDIFIKPTQFHCCEELGVYRIPPED